MNTITQTATETLTFAKVQKGRVAGKTFEMTPDGIISQTAYTAGKWTSFSEATVNSLDDVLTALSSRARSRNCYLLLSKPIRLGGPQRRLKHRRDEDGPDGEPTLIDAPRRYLIVDIDGLSCSGDVASLTPEEAVRLACSVLPPEFSTADCILHRSSSFGIKPGLRCHLIFWLSRPVTPGEIRIWLSEAIGRRNIDQAIYGTVQPIYFADPLFVDWADPFPDRWFKVASPFAEEVRVPSSFAKPPPKAVQSGGPTGGSLPATSGDTAGGWRGHLSRIGNDADGYFNPIQAAVASFVGLYGADADPTELFDEIDQVLDGKCRAERGAEYAAFRKRDLRVWFDRCCGLERANRPPAAVAFDDDIFAHPVDRATQAAEAERLMRGLFG